MFSQDLYLSNNTVEAIVLELSRQAEAAKSKVNVQVAAEKRAEKNGSESVTPDLSTLIWESEENETVNNVFTR